MGQTRYFNPHFRKGSDGAFNTIAIVLDDFNPHFRKGSDEIDWDSPSVSMISIHTSAREVTVSSWESMFHAKFQSTLPQGK